MIRHGNVIRGLGSSIASLAIEPLPITMIEPAFGA
jgi:hypothetical protein